MLYVLINCDSFCSLFNSDIVDSCILCQAYLFNDYWEDIGTIKSYFDANLALAAQVIFWFHYSFDFFTYKIQRILLPLCLTGVSILLRMRVKYVLMRAIVFKIASLWNCLKRNIVDSQHCSLSSFHHCNWGGL